MHFRHKYETRVLPFYRRGRFGEFAGAGGLAIRYAAFRRKDSAGALLVLPGKSETYLKYAELFYDLRDLPLSLYGMDHRGMGFSERLLPDPLKIHVQRFQDYVEDARTFVENVVKAGSSGPLYLLGHSTGALIAALYLEQHPRTFRAGILCSPLFDLSVGPLSGTLLRFLAGLLDAPGRHERYAPGQKNSQRPSFRKNALTHSRARWSLWEEETIPGNEAIRLGGVTNRWIRESLRAAHRAIREAHRIEAPLLLLQAGRDTVTRTAAQEDFRRRARRHTTVSFPEARHEILIERDDIRSEAIARIRDFLQGSLAGS